MTTTKTTTTKTTPLEEEEEQQQQAIAFDKTTEKGAPDGLFQACMKAIRTTHASANRLRMGLVVAGLFTDVKVYREVIALFYLASKALETNLLSLQQKDEICTKLLSLGYRFTPQYELDLQTLYSPDTWKKDVDSVFNQLVSPGARAYIANIQAMTTGAELAGAAFCLWGALIIGGGAVAMPRVEALCGKDAIHIFADVTGPGRGERKTKFVQVWDSLATNDDDDSNSNEIFQTIVESCQECMQGNSELISSVKRNPWWLKYALSITIGLAALVAGAFFHWHSER